MKLINLKSALPAAFAASALFFQPQPVHAVNQCQEACNLYTECVELMNNRSATPSERQTISGGCMKTCNTKKHQEGILMCYRESKGKDKAQACNAYAQCIMKNSKK